MMDNPGMKPVFFKSAADFRAWLEARYEQYQELWVGFYKKSCAKPSITYPEAVDEALCFGWIDGVRKSVDDAYTVRFTPRKLRSQWSAVNIKRGEKLARGPPKTCRRKSLCRGQGSAAQILLRAASAGQLRASAGAAISRPPPGLGFLSETAAVVPAHCHILGGECAKTRDSAEAARHPDSGLRVVEADQTLDPTGSQTAEKNAIKRSCAQKPCRDSL